MENQKEFKLNINDWEKFLESGHQTEITPKIQEIADKFHGSFEDKTKQMVDFVKKFHFNNSNKSSLFRKRTAEEIIDSGFVTGCTDSAIVFITLARACKIPAKYIETFDHRLLQDEKSTVSGHVYSSLFDVKNGEWKIFDLDKGNTDISKDGRIVFKEGIDSWNLGVGDYDSLEKAFQEFKKEFNS
jgi:transglutaminase-like putative cysteine protease